ncbi:MAG TPA: hypothetical protein VF224_00460 [Aestuariivirga sp.]
MPSAIKAGLLYFVIVFAAGFVLGTLRVIVLLPLIGEIAAVAFELPAMLVISWLACRRLAAQFSVPARIPHRLAMGAAAFGLLMLAEFGLSVFAFNRSGAEYFALFLTTSGLLGLTGQIAFGLFPLLQLRQKGN